MSHNTTIAQQLSSGMKQQFFQWRSQLQQGKTRLGWKVGFNRESDQQAAGLSSLQVGYLLAEQRFLSPAEISLEQEGKYLVEGEIAIRMASTLSADATTEQAEAAVETYAPALELVNLKRNLGDDIQSLLACNMVHEAVILGEQQQSTLDLTKLHASFTVNQQPAIALDTSRVPAHFGPLLCQVAKILEANGEQLQAGDWIITGAATTPTPVTRGDKVTFQLAEFAPLKLNFS